MDDLYSRQSSLQDWKTHDLAMKDVSLERKAATLTQKLESLVRTYWKERVEEVMFEQEEHFTPYGRVPSREFNRWLKWERKLQAAADMNGDLPRKAVSYCRRWSGIATSTQRIPRQKAECAVKAAYRAIGRSAPEVTFFDSPYAAVEALKARLRTKLDKQLTQPAHQTLMNRLSQQLSKQLQSQSIQQLPTKELRAVVRFLGEQFSNEIDSHLNREPGRQLQQAVTDVFGSDLRTELNRGLRGRLNQQLLDRLGCSSSLYRQSSVLEASHYLSQLPSGALLQDLEQDLTHDLYETLESKLRPAVTRQLKDKLGRELWHQLLEQLFWPLLRSLPSKLPFIQPESWLFDASWFDLCLGYIRWKPDRKKLAAFQSLICHCGWILPKANSCWLIDRPIQLSFDRNHALHAESKPAIQFADRRGVYVYHGTVLPERYGKHHPDRWQPQWLLQEDNAERRRVLIEGIGYDRICQELQAEKLDVHREYALLKIKTPFDREPMCLLKMTCPSTGHIHALRVPPNFDSAQEAIRWINWGVNPAEFAVET